jgi:peptidoglycan-N-acetylglucosamine deacetylase
MIELLSLEHGLTGYQMKVGLTYNEGYASRVLAIDEFTYNQLSGLGPFDRARVRLSLYPKWDPFRKIHYSTLIKMDRSFGETLYFACSENYMSQLSKWKLGEAGAGLTGEALDLQPALPPPEPLLIPATNRRKRIRPIVLRCIIFSLLLTLVMLRMGGNLYTDSAEAVEGPEATAEIRGSASGAFPPVLQNASVRIQQSHTAAASTVTSEKQGGPFEEIELDLNHPLYGVPKGYVALSFDDGPSPYTKQIVDILVENEAAATFLFVGHNAVQQPDEVRYTSRYDMPIGSHSWDHSQMTRNSVQENEVNLAKANLALEQITGLPVTIFRPPYGSINTGLANNVREENMKVLLWNRDPEDWNATSPEEILRYFRHTDPSGGIYLLHEKRTTVEALPEIIKYLKGKNLKFAIFK